MRFAQDQSSQIIYHLLRAIVMHKLVVHPRLRLRSNVIPDTNLYGEELHLGDHCHCVASILNS